MNDRKTVEPIIFENDHVHVIGMSHVGCVREENQDFLGHCSKEGWELLVVCDGMGGHSGGFEASRLAVRSIQEYFREQFEEDQFEDPKPWMEEAIQHADNCIQETSVENPRLKGMGTTVVLLLTRGQQAWIAHVGDSRIYLLRQRELALLTVDHIAINRFVIRGELHPDETKNHRLSHILERCVGATEGKLRVDVANDPILLQKGDRFILCSDGFHGLAEDVNILEHFDADYPLKMSVEKGIKFSLDNGADDNTTIGALEIVSTSYMVDESSLEDSGVFDDHDTTIPLDPDDLQKAIELSSAGNNEEEGFGDFDPFGDLEDEESIPLPKDARAKLLEAYNHSRKMAEKKTQ